MGRERSTDRERFWRDALRRRAASGMTVGDFCAREGLKPTTYHYWQQQIRRRDSDSSANVASDKSALTAVPVVDDLAASEAALEVVAQNGYRVRIGDLATSEQLRPLLQAACPRQF